MNKASVLSPNLSRRISIRKPSVRSSGGIVVSQNRVASEAGARVLKAGGHAVDAAVATAFYGRRGRALDERRRRRRRHARL